MEDWLKCQISSFVKYCQNQKYLLGKTQVAWGLSINVFYEELYSVCCVVEFVITVKCM